MAADKAFFLIVNMAEGSARSRRLLLLSPFVHPLWV